MMHNLSILLFKVLSDNIIIHTCGCKSWEKTCKLLPFAEGKLFMVENYLEAVVMMTPAYDLLGQAAVKSGVSAGAVRRPLGETKVTCGRATQVQIKQLSVVKK